MESAGITGFVSDAAANAEVKTWQLRRRQHQHCVLCWQRNDRFDVGSSDTGHTAGTRSPQLGCKGPTARATSRNTEIGRGGCVGAAIHTLSVRGKSATLPCNGGSNNGDCRSLDTTAAAAIRSSNSTVSSFSHGALLNLSLLSAVFANNFTK
mmetsp:Transcript_56214/g.108471  ORF Transcript_56214/g.108471 Transcript_56214/m.108471 type:complete len:152 (-) Transcript_56214:437-892(-)